MNLIEIIVNEENEFRDKNNVKLKKCKKVGDPLIIDTNHMDCYLKMIKELYGFNPIEDKILKKCNSNVETIGYLFIDKNYTVDNNSKKIKPLNTIQFYVIEYYKNE